MKISCGLVQADVIGLIDGAQRRLVLVSPFIELWPALTNAIDRAAARGVETSLIARGGPEAEKNACTLRPIQRSLAFVGFVERLHAKVYLNEEAAILTSMNLVKGSALNTIEVSAFIEKRWAKTEYQQLRRICDTLIETSKEDELRLEAERAAAAKASGDVRGRAPKRGFCIRCGVRVSFALVMPLCEDCFATWNRHKNKDYEEGYCHKCGERCDTTFGEPLCIDC